MGGISMWLFGGGRGIRSGLLEIRKHGLKVIDGVGMQGKFSIHYLQNIKVN